MCYKTTYINKALWEYPVLIQATHTQDSAVSYTGVMGKLVFSLVLVVMSLLQSQSKPLQAESWRELAGLLQDLDSLSTHEAEEAWLDLNIPEKRALPRLGVTMYRPPSQRVSNGKTAEGVKYSFTFPVERMAGVQG